MSSLNVRPTALLPWLAAGLLAATISAVGPASAGEVYQWKDAKGVTHYADSPPSNQAHKSRTINPLGAAAVAAAAGKPVAVNADCSNARGNLTILQRQGEVGIDEDKDGTNDRNLTAQERADRIKLAEAGIKIYCEVALTNQP